MKLELIYHHEAMHPPSAWFLQRRDPAEWLELVCRAGWDQQKLRMLPVPVSTKDLTPQGVLFIVQDTSIKDARLVPFAEIHPHIYLPCHASLSAAVLQEEWETIFSHKTYTVIWLPQLGVIGVEHEKLLKIKNLFVNPSFSTVNWNQADPGIAFNTRLRSLLPDQSDTWENFKAAAKGDIGTQAKNPELMPVNPTEAKQDVLSQAARNVAQAGIMGGAIAAFGVMQTFSALNNAISRIFGQKSSPGSPANAASQNPLAKAMDGIMQWAKNQQQRITDSINEARHKEISRLLNMLKSNPDEGLKFAIPMSAQGDASRGIAKPGTSLMARSTNFSLFGNSAGPADFWDIQADYQQKLRQTYRDLANREIALGRHRRAAYIFAELLGEYLNAANTLADGKHFREAAVLYKDRLNDPRRAADCLRKGGLLSEAIPLYEVLKEYEIAGDLYQELKQTAAAEEAYEMAVQKAITADNYLKASELYHDKLTDQERALKVLDRGWNTSTTQRQLCLYSIFELLERYELHARAIDYLQTVTKDVDDVLDQTAHTLTQIAWRYPDQEFQDFAKDQLRIIIGSKLTKAADRTVYQLAGKSDQTAMLQELSRLEPADRLLSRDTMRYQRITRPERKVEPAKPVSKKETGKITKIDRFYLPCGNCLAFLSSGSHCYIAGYQQSGLQIYRLHPDRTIESSQSLIDKPAHTDLSYLKMYWVNSDKKSILVNAPGIQASIKQIEFPELDTSHFKVSAGSFAGFSDNTVACSVTSFNNVVVLDYVQGNIFKWNLFSPQATLIKSKAVTLDVEAETGVIDLRKLDLFHTHQRSMIGIGKQLFSHKDEALDQIFYLKHEFRQFAEGYMFRLAALMDVGALLLYGNMHEPDTSYLAEDLVNPVATFTDQGEIIIAGENGIEIHNMTKQGPSLAGKLNHDLEKPLGIFYKNQGGVNKERDKTFMVINTDGDVEVFTWT